MWKRLKNIKDAVLYKAIFHSKNNRSLTTMHSENKKTGRLYKKTVAASPFLTKGL
jgi:hypothetical protein